MDVINEIIRQSAIGPLSKGYRSLVLSIFSSIVLILFAMLLAILLNAPQLNITYGY
jgi:hypothetical protein